MKTNFTKSDLKSGMAIKLRSGLVGIVMNEKYYCLADNGGYDELEYYDEDLTNSKFPDSDIVAVGAYATGLDKKHIEKALENPIWERKSDTVDTSKPAEPNCIGLQRFLKYVKTYMTYHNSIKQVVEILFGDPALTPPMPYVADFEIEYIKMVTKLLGIKDEEMADELINWFYIDECGKDDHPISFNQVQLNPVEVYEKVAQNR